MPKAIKPSIHLRMFESVSVLTTFSAPPQILAKMMLWPNSQRRNDGRWFPFGATAAGLFEQ